VLKPDRWLGTLLARPAFNVVSFDDQEALRAALPPTPALVTAKISARDTAVSIRLQELGFRVIDTALTFETAKIRESEDEVSVRFARAEDLAAVEAIARNSFRFTRFHLDPSIAVETANSIQAAWAANYFNGQRGDGMIVAELDGAVVGFLLAVMNDEWLTIDLIAVDAGAVRRGMGAAMIHFAAKHGVGAAAPSGFRVATQAANAPSCRLYENVGFRFHGASIVLHHHGLTK
jgi:ribosomal protein S18 acetylase RimI-like enzyme